MASFTIWCRNQGFGLKVSFNTNAQELTQRLQRDFEKEVNTGGISIKKLMLHGLVWVIQWL